MSLWVKYKKHRKIEDITIPIPREGIYLRQCTNWNDNYYSRLLSIPWKIMVTMMLNCIRSAVDKRLSQKQAGFGPSRSCCKQNAHSQIDNRNTFIDQLQTSTSQGFWQRMQRFDIEDNEELWNSIKDHWHRQKFLWWQGDSYINTYIFCISSCNDTCI